VDWPGAVAEAPGVVLWVELVAPGLVVEVLCA
jgi:hypothetical protein